MKIKQSEIKKRLVELRQARYIRTAFWVSAVFFGLGILLMMNALLIAHNAMGLVICAETLSRSEIIDEVKEEKY